MIKDDSVHKITIVTKQGLVIAFENIDKLEFSITSKMNAFFPDTSEPLTLENLDDFIKFLSEVVLRFSGSDIKINKRFKRPGERKNLRKST